MYCATSFCEREHSSKRVWMYFERLWCSPVRPTGGSCTVEVDVVRLIGPVVRRALLGLLPNGLCFSAPRLHRH